MIKRKQFNTYLEKRFTDMENHLMEFSLSGDQEELHQFRVSVKKIKAVISFLEFIRHQQNLTNEFKPLKKVFKQAGKIRALHVELLIMQLYSLKDEHYIKQQRELIVQLSADFGKTIKKHLAVLKKVKKKLLSKTEKLHDKDVKAYVESQLKNLNKRFLSHKDVKEYHKARMMLKNLFYTYSLFDKKLKEKLNLDKEYYDKLQDTLGKWHDAATALNHLTEGTALHKPVFTQLKKREQTLFRSVKSLTNYFYKKAFLTLQKGKPKK